MDATEQSIQALVVRLQAIAKKNRDEFRCRIEPRNTPKGMTFTFVCEETAENHCFTSGVGSSIVEAVKDAEAYIPEALKSWGYM